MSSYLPDRDGAPLRVRILGEDLIAFRDTDSQVGLVSAFCPHRRAPMFFGRNEECGLRCVYHGWKFDVTGACVDMPSESPESLFKTKVAIEAYPTREAADVIWAYMGPPGQVPAFPDYEWMRAPHTHRHVSKTFQDCNWMQALEGGVDTAHSSFLHNEDLQNKAYLRNADTAPRLDVDKTSYGFTYAGIRSFGERDYVRVYQYIMPAQQFRGFVKGNLEKESTHIPSIHGHLWIPIDDEHTTTWNWMYSYDPAQPLTEEYATKFEIGAGRGPDDLIPGTYWLKKNLRNDYLIDRQLQKTKTFTGIVGINTQDIGLQEGMGPICDRTKEHLGTTDRAVIVARQLLLEALDELKAGRATRALDPATYRNVRAVDMFTEKDVDWRVALKDEVLARF